MIRKFSGRCEIEAGKGWEKGWVQERRKDELSPSALLVLLADSLLP